MYNYNLYYYNNTHADYLLQGEISFAFMLNSHEETYSHADTSSLEEIVCFSL